MTIPVTEFVIASLLMGLGIGLDVAIATMARSRHLNATRTATFWIVGVSATHTLFPLAGYALALFSVNLHPLMTPIVGLIAFCCIFLYLKTELWSDDNKDETASSHDHLLVTSALILAVSWDALWSGPAKSAQVIDWPDAMVWGSFIVVGLMVFILAFVSYRIALTWQASKLDDHSLSLGLWVQYSVIGYFGLLALSRYTLQLHLPWWVLLVAAFAIIGGVMVSANRRLLSLALHNEKLSIR